MASLFKAAGIDAKLLMVVSGLGVGITTYYVTRLAYSSPDVRVNPNKPMFLQQNHEEGDKYYNHIFRKASRESLKSGEFTFNGALNRFFGQKEVERERGTH